MANGKEIKRDASGNFIIDLFPTEKQKELINCKADTIFFGGARGGGKTYGAGITTLNKVMEYGKNFRGIFFRRSFPELSDAISQFKEIYSGCAVWKDTTKKFTFWNGAELLMGYIDRIDDASRYQGGNYCFMVFDEVTNFCSYKCVTDMRGCLRNAQGIPTQLLMSGNPGGPLHLTLKEQFIDPYPEGGVLIPDGFSKDLKRQTWKCFIKSLVDDNPYLRDTEYKTNLMKLGSPEQIRQWLYGDWNQVVNAAFSNVWNPSVHIIKPFTIPRTWKIKKSYDYGSSHPWACCWFAISDGSDFIDANGYIRSTIPGDIFVVRELYGSTGQANVGDKASIQVQAERIKFVEETYFADREIVQSIADSAIFASASQSYCISDDFEEMGVYWERCNKFAGSREHGYKMMLDRMLASWERDAKPGIFWFTRCQNCIRTIPNLQMSHDGTDTVATGNNSEDHLYDLHCYLLLAEDAGEVQSGSSGNY